MIDWVDEVMYVWGIERRRIDEGGRRLGKDDDAPFHVDGWPTRSITGKSKDEGEGASHIAGSQNYPEALTGDSLRVSIALVGAPESLRRVAYAHYVVPKRVVPTKRKVEVLGFKHRTAYYEALEAAHQWVAARWDVPRETIRSNTVATV